MHVSINLYFIDKKCVLTDNDRNFKGTTHITDRYKLHS